MGTENSGYFGEVRAKKNYLFTPWGHNPPAGWCSLSVEYNYFWFLISIDKNKTLFEVLTRAKGCKKIPVVSLK